MRRRRRRRRVPVKITCCFFFQLIANAWLSPDKQNLSHIAKVSPKVGVQL